MMKTMRWRIDSQRPDQGLIAQAAALLKAANWWLSHRNSVRSGS